MFSTRTQRYIEYVCATGDGPFKLVLTEDGTLSGADQRQQDFIRTTPYKFKELWEAFPTNLCEDEMKEWLRDADVKKPATALCAELGTVTEDPLFPPKTILDTVNRVASSWLTSCLIIKLTTPIDPTAPVTYYAVPPSGNLLHVVKAGRGDPICASMDSGIYGVNAWEWKCIDPVPLFKSPEIGELVGDIADYLREHWDDEVDYPAKIREFYRLFNELTEDSDVLDERTHLVAIRVATFDILTAPTIIDEDAEEVG